MLAYVFWHWPASEARSAREAYERTLLEFHRVLAAQAPPGFGRSTTGRAAGVPWLGEHRRGYEDWYLVDGFAALESLNEGAVSGARRAAHDRAAQAAAGGTAGLYRPWGTEAVLEGARWAAWFAKPAGSSYPDLLEELAPWRTRDGVSLWQRQMTLGPGPEFCLRAPERLELPVRLAALEVGLEPLWP